MSTSALSPDLPAARPVELRGLDRALVRLGTGLAEHGRARAAARAAARPAVGSAVGSPAAAGTSTSRARRAPGAPGDPGDPGDPGTAAPAARAAHLERGRDNAAQLHPLHLR